VKQKIIIEIRGGVLVAVYARDPAIEVLLVDWDDDVEAGSTQVSVPFPVDALGQMPEDTKAAVGERGARQICSLSRPPC
jgi:hypothetical protein